MKKKENVRAAVPVLRGRCRFRSFAGRGSARHQIFLPLFIDRTLYLIKDGLGPHHRLQIDNDLHSTLESEKLV